MFSVFSALLIAVSLAGIFLYSFESQQPNAKRSTVMAWVSKGVER